MVDQSAMSLAGLGAACRRSRSQLSVDLSGKVVPDWHTVEQLVRACSGSDEKAAELRLARAEVLWARARAAQQIAAETASVTEAGAEKPSRWHVGPVASWDPVSLGIHRAIGGDPLPPYVPRDKDVQLRSVLDRRVGGSQVIVITGWSSTGKTRSMFEAVRARLPGWDLVYPSGPDVLGWVVEAGLKPCTILWLNEFKDYLGVSGAQALERLRAVLPTLVRVIVVTTMWPDLWPRIMDTGASPEAGESYAQARGLLKEVVQLGNVIELPEEFSDPELDRARALASGTVLATALDAAGPGGRVAQALAGVPQLVAHYEGRPGSEAGGSDAAAPSAFVPEGHPSPYGWAVITAAMDAFRLGCHAPVSAAMLRQAAVGYLTDRQRAAPATWFEDALGYATKTLVGAIRPLTGVRISPGIGEPDGYVLADYLGQHAGMRQDVLVPASTWEALAEHTTNAEALERLGSAARGRLLKRFEAIFCYRRAVAGDADAMNWLARLLQDAGQADAADEWLAAAADAGNRHAMMAIADILKKRGDVDGAVAAINRACEAGWGHFTSRMSQLLQGAGRIEEAIDIWRPAAESGDAHAMLAIAHIMADAGRYEERREWLRKAALSDDDEAGDTALEQLLGPWYTLEAYRRAAMRRTQEALEDALAGGTWKTPGNAAEWLLGDSGKLYRQGRSGEISELIESMKDMGAWLRSNAEAGSPRAMCALAFTLRREGALADAESWLIRAAEAGAGRAINDLDSLLRQSGRFADAAEIWRPLAQAGWIVAIRKYADYLCKEGRIDEAAAAWVPSANSGSYEAINEIAGILYRAGRFIEAIAILRSAADAGSVKALHEMARRFEKLGLTDMAADCLRKAIAAGETDAFRSLALLFKNAGRVDEALAAFEASAEAGSEWAVDDAASLIVAAGRVDDVRPWLSRAITLRQQNQQGWGESAMRTLTGYLVQVGGADEAVAAWRPFAEAGQRGAIRHLIDLLQEAGRAEEARRWLVALANAGDIHALFSAVGLLDSVQFSRQTLDWLRQPFHLSEREHAFTSILVRELEQAGRLDDALTWLRRAAEAGYHGATKLAVRIASQVGRSDEYIEWLRQLADSGRDRYAIEQLLGILERNAQYSAEAVERLRFIIVTGHRAGYGESDSLSRRLANQLRAAGRPEEARQQMTFGLEPDGSTASAWRIPAPVSHQAAM